MIFCVRKLLVIERDGALRDFVCRDEDIDVLLDNQ
jgi:hypothetical protein